MAVSEACDKVRYRAGGGREREWGCWEGKYCKATGVKEAELLGSQERLKSHLQHPCHEAIRPRAGGIARCEASVALEACLPVVRIARECERQRTRSWFQWWQGGLRKTSRGCTNTVHKMPVQRLWFSGDSSDIC